MAKQRCPDCGATHRQATSKCRLCGRDLTGTVEHVRGSTRRQPRRRSGSGLMIILLVVLGVGIVVLIAAALGIGRSDPMVAQVPFAPEGPDGWQSFEDPETGLRAELPGTAERSVIPYPGSADDEAVTWTARVADEVIITIATGPLAPSEASARRLPVEIAQQWAEGLDGRVREVHETTFQDTPAAELDVADLEVEGTPGRGRVFAFASDGSFLTVTVQTIYVDAPALSRVLDSLELAEHSGT